MAHVRSTPRVFVDLDGVLADFDKGAEHLLGIKTSRDNEPIGLWRAIAHHGNFFAALPEMPEMHRLWDGIREVCPTPVVLTGMPMIKGACEQKTQWVREHLGLFQVICTASREKYKHARPGDILIDDWAKYIQPWVKAGGTFIQYKNVDQALQDLKWVLSQEEASGV